MGVMFRLIFVCIIAYIVYVFLDERGLIAPILDRFYVFIDSFDQVSVV
jgi:hypothetical protein